MMHGLTSLKFKKKQLYLIAFVHALFSVCSADDNSLGKLHA